MSIDYLRWLDIPLAEQPPNHYRLFGLAPFERDIGKITYRSDATIARVQQRQAENPDQIKQLLYELTLARLCLLNTGTKAKYDHELQQLGVASSQHPATFVPTATHFNAPNSFKRASAKKRSGLPVAALAVAAMAAVVAVALTINTRHDEAEQSALAPLSNPPRTNRDEEPRQKPTRTRSDATWDQRAADNQQQSPPAVSADPVAWPHTPLPVPMLPSTDDTSPPEPREPGGLPRIVEKRPNATEGADWRLDLPSGDYLSRNLCLLDRAKLKTVFDRESPSFVMTDSRGAPVAVFAITGKGPVFHGPGLAVDGQGKDRRVVRISYKARDRIGREGFDRHGQFWVWDDNRSPILLTEFKYDHRIGITCLFENGRPRLVQQWSPGEKHLDRFIRDVDGDLIADDDLSSEAAVESLKSIDALNQWLDSEEKEWKVALNKWWRSAQAKTRALNDDARKKAWAESTQRANATRDKFIDSL